MKIVYNFYVEERFLKICKEMVILLNKKNKCLKETINCVFVNHFKKNITQNDSSKKRYLNMYIVMASLMTFLSCIKVAGNVPNERRSKFIHEEDVENSDYVSSEEDVIRFKNPDDLIYRDYGSNALQVDENSKIIINLNGFNSYNTQYIYVYNCIAGKTIKFQFSNMIEYENVPQGVYFIYMITIDGKKIDLSRNTMVEHNINSGNGVVGL